jgi:hypothetical protein
MRHRSPNAGEVLRRHSSGAPSQFGRAVTVEDGMKKLVVASALCGVLLPMQAAADQLIIRASTGSVFTKNEDFCANYESANISVVQSEGVSGSAHITVMDIPITGVPDGAEVTRVRVYGSDTGSSAMTFYVYKAGASDATPTNVTTSWASGSGGSWASATSARR